MEYLDTALLIYIACNLYYIAYCINYKINQDEFKERKRKK